MHGAAAINEAEGAKLDLLAAQLMAEARRMADIHAPGAAQMDDTDRAGSALSAALQALLTNGETHKLPTLGAVIWTVGTAAASIMPDHLDRVTLQQALAAFGEGLVDGHAANAAATPPNPVKAH